MFSHNDVIGHMVWQPYWIYPKTYKNTPLKRIIGKGLQSLIALFLVINIIFIIMVIIIIIIIIIPSSRATGDRNLQSLLRVCLSRP